MKVQFIIICFLTFGLFSCKSDKSGNKATSENMTEIVNETVTTKKSEIKITPISHATFILQCDSTVIYIDPVGGSSSFKDQPKPDLILVTDIHGDHMNAETLEGIATENTQLVLPKIANEQLSEKLKTQSRVISNGQSLSLTINNNPIKIEAIPMYNLRPEALQFHSKGRGNGYVLTLGGQRVYISGDTEDIPEMRSLKNIDIAFVCMNLPYTMTVESAASAVLEFKPKKVYPYHYRGTGGLSDVDKFKHLVNAGDSNIEVVQLDWYPVN